MQCLRRHSTILRHLSEPHLVFMQRITSNYIPSHSFHQPQPFNEKLWKEAYEMKCLPLRDEKWKMKFSLLQFIASFYLNRLTFPKKFRSSVDFSAKVIESISFSDRIFHFANLDLSNGKEGLGHFSSIAKVLKSLSTFSQPIIPPRRFEVFIICQTGERHCRLMDRWNNHFNETCIFLPKNAVTKTMWFSWKSFEIAVIW